MNNLAIISYLLFYIIFLLYDVSVMGIKTIIRGPSEEKKDVAASLKAFNFMKKFGYLESGTESEAIYTKEAFSEAVKNVQRFGSIPQTGVVDNATLQLMSSPRCGLSDIIRTSPSYRRKRFVIGNHKWKKRQLTFCVTHVPSYLDKNAVTKIVQLALDTWGKYGGLTFSRVNDSNADIVVLFARGFHGDNFNFDGPGKTLAHAFFPTNEGLGGDAHFDEDEPWTTNNEKDKIDFSSVAVHELGHSLGLGHSDVKTSIMFPYYIEPTSNFKLDYDDILAIYELYYKRNEWNPSNDPSIGTTKKYPERTTKSFHEQTRKPYHRPKFTERPITTTTIQSKSDIPNICEGRFDAISMLRGELFVFKGNYLWRLREKQEIVSGYPITFRHMFPELPKDVEKIDACYEKPDGTIVLFTGNKFWKFDGSKFIDSPRPLTDYGLPSYLDKIDAVQNWKANGKTYFYRRDRFWRYNETIKKIDEGYPKKMEKWRGVPNDIDAALTWKDGKTYFFKDKLYWTFDNKWIMVSENSPLPAPEAWIGCPEDQQLLNYLFVHH